MSEVTSYTKKSNGKVIKAITGMYPPRHSWRVHSGVLNQSLYFNERYTVTEVRTAYARIRNVDYFDVLAARVK